MSDFYEFNRFRHITSSGDMSFKFREGDQLVNASIKGKTIRIRVRRLPEDERLVLLEKQLGYEECEEPQGAGGEA